MLGCINLDNKLKISLKLNEKFDMGGFFCLEMGENFQKEIDII